MLDFDRCGNQRCTRKSEQDQIASAPGIRSVTYQKTSIYRNASSKMYLEIYAKWLPHLCLDQTTLVSVRHHRAQYIHSNRPTQQRSVWQRMNGKQTFDCLFKCWRIHFSSRLMRKIQNDGLRKSAQHKARWSLHRLLTKRFYWQEGFRG